MIQNHKSHYLFSWALLQILTEKVISIIRLNWILKKASAFSGESLRFRSKTGMSRQNANPNNDMYSYLAFRSGWVSKHGIFQIKIGWPFIFVIMKYWQTVHGPREVIVCYIQWPAHSVMFLTRHSVQKNAISESKKRKTKQTELTWCMIHLGNWYVIPANL